MVSNTIIVLFGLIIALKAHDHYNHIKKEMEKDEIVPNILPDYPRHHIHVTYPNNVTVNLGNELTPTQVKDEPHVKYDADPNKFYTLVMFDPDAPSRENNTFADVKHWLVVNIQGDNMKTTGDVIAEYLGSGPPKNTGLHRYIFVVYQQTARLDFDEPRSLQLSRANRLRWSLKDFVKKYNLELLAGDYYKAQWDEYVDERNKFITNN